MQNMQNTEESIDKYKLFIALYGPRHAATELIQAWIEGYREGFEEISQEYGKNLWMKVTLDVLKNNCNLDKIAQLTELDTEILLKLAKDNNLLDS